MTDRQTDRQTEGQRKRQADGDRQTEERSAGLVPHVRCLVQEMKQSMLSELVNQASPHNIMMTIMKAVMIVLGVSEEKLEVKRASFD